MKRQTALIGAVFLTVAALGGWKLGFTGAGGGWLPDIPGASYEDGDTSSSRKVHGYDIYADWVYDGDSGTWTSEGAVEIGAFTFDSTDMTIEDGDLHGLFVSEDAGPLDFEIDVVDGCALAPSSSEFGLEGGDTILDRFPGASVLADEAYFYFHTEGDQTLKCKDHKVELPEGDNEIYLNPSDPSFFVTAVLDIKNSNTKKVRPFSVEEITLGMSENGLIPWKSTEKDANGDKEEFNAHIVVGGEFETRVSGMPIGVNNGSSGYRFDSDGELKKACVSGELVIPVYDIPIIGSVDLPVGEGVGCRSDSTFVVHSKADMSDWGDLDLPDDVLDLVDRLGTSKSTMDAEIDIDNPDDFELAFNQDWPICGGLVELEGDLLIDSEGVALQGVIDGEIDPVDFGDIAVEGTFKDSGLEVKGSAKAKLLGLKKLKLNADFTWTDTTLTATMFVDAYGWTLDGEALFQNFQLVSAIFSTGFEVPELATGAEIKAIIIGAGAGSGLSAPSVIVSATGTLFGLTCSNEIDTSGCFTICDILEVCL